MEEDAGNVTLTVSILSGSLVPGRIVVVNVTTVDGSAVGEIWLSIFGGDNLFQQT